ncbi:Putative tail sheath family protein [Avibacterium paragallinarum JF4211]|uniref:Tail sheath phage protein n=1 Tax=Avibacterium paragallinarum TaxID=728 RepID=A0A377I4F5_AVIPA|nr:Putative tail sheath family protein [Avibacterium paragallinarum JF4211]STO70174.1 tail sheath phage protein [Avibacterium paragallinarum]
MYPYVRINALNQLSGPTKEVERHALFVGVGETNKEKLIAITPDSDLDKVFGTTETELKKQVHTAMVNANSD